MSPSSQQRQLQELLRSFRVPRVEPPPAPAGAGGRGGGGRAATNDINLARLLLSLGLPPDTLGADGVAASGGSKKPRKGKASAAVSGGKDKPKKSRPASGGNMVSLPASVVRGCTPATCSPAPVVITRPPRVQVRDPVFAYEFFHPPPHNRTPKSCQVKGCGQQITVYNAMKDRWECLNH